MKTNFNKRNNNKSANNSMNNNAAKMAANRAEEHRKKVEILEKANEFARTFKNAKKTDAIKEVLSNGLEAVKATALKNENRVMEFRQVNDGGSHWVKKTIHGEMKPLDCSGRKKDGLKISANVLGVDLKIEYTSEVEFDTTSEFLEKATESYTKVMECSKDAVIDVTRFLINAIPVAMKSFKGSKNEDSYNDHKSNDGFEPVE